MYELYAKLDPKQLVCPQKPLNLDALAQKTYFQDAVWVVKKLGLEPHITLQLDYDIEMIHQFYATLELGDEEDTSLTWMTGPVQCRSSFSEFAAELGYPYNGASKSAGRRMHQNGDRKSTRLNSSHITRSRMPSSA